MISFLYLSSLPARLEGIAALERKRQQALHSKALIIQKHARGFLSRKSLFQKQSASIVIQKTFRCWRYRTDFKRQRAAANVIRSAFLRYRFRLLFQKKVTSCFTFFALCLLYFVYFSIHPFNTKLNEHNPYAPAEGRGCGSEKLS